MTISSPSSAPIGSRFRRRSRPPRDPHRSPRPARPRRCATASSPHYAAFGHQRRRSAECTQPCRRPRAHRPAGIDGVPRFPRRRAGIAPIEYQPSTRNEGTADVSQRPVPVVIADEELRDVRRHHRDVESSMGSNTEVPSSQVTRSARGFARAAASGAAAGSTPVTRCPAAAMASVSRPVPHPKSSTRAAGVSLTNVRKKSSSRDHTQTASYTSKMSATR